MRLKRYAPCSSITSMLSTPHDQSHIVTMPTFAAIFDEAEAIAIDEQAYEVASLISADEQHRASVERRMRGEDVRRYHLIMDRAYSNLALAENTRGKIQLQ